MHKPCGVLYGPPELVSLARKALEDTSENIVVLGRLFRREKIEFGTHSCDFKGLLSEDVILRDYDRALFLARIIERTDHFPIFALCPGDDPLLEKHVQANDVLIGLPLVPAGCDRDLFWYMALPDNDRAEIDSSDAGARTELLEQRIRKMFGKKHVTNIDRKLFETPDHANQSEGNGTTLGPDRRSALHDMHGDQILPLFRASDRISEIMSSQELPKVPGPVSH